MYLFFMIYVSARSYYKKESNSLYAMANHVDSHSDVTHYGIIQVKTNLNIMV